LWIAADGALLHPSLNGLDLASRRRRSWLNSPYPCSGGHGGIERRDTAAAIWRRRYGLTVA
jgi:hypothetical protein